MQVSDMKIQSVMFHHFFDEKHIAGQGAISADQLAALITKIGRNRILSADEWSWETRRGTVLNDAIALTFDDGLLCQYEVALPVLDSFNIEAFWFVNSSPLHGESRNSLEMYRFFRSTYYEDINLFYADFQNCAKSTYGQLIVSALEFFSPDDYIKNVTFYTREDRSFRYLRDIVLGSDRYDVCMEKLYEDRGFDPEINIPRLWIDNSRLKVLSDERHVIGLHSYSHPTRISDLSFSEQEREYKRNFEHIAAVTGVRPQTMSHPCNSYNDDSLEILRNLGVELGFRANFDIKKISHSKLEIPRTDHSLLIKYLEL
jgi:peptidoglycan/xylan/chitin deacetylase (PgdA/CDA1 family)